MFVGDSIPGLVWPSVPSPRAARLLALLFQLEQTQWWAPERLAEQQLRQARVLVRHAVRAAPYYGELYAKHEVNADSLDTLERFRALPIIRRRDVQLAGERIHATPRPRVHGKIGETLTSGSTGRPLRALSTAVTRSFWQLLTLRDHFWQRRDFTGTLAVIRDTASDAARPPNGKRADNWGGATRGVIVTGPAHLLSIQSTLEEQADWLERVNPDYLLAYPTTVLGLARLFQQRGRRLSKLREVRTFGEIVEAPIRLAARETWNAPLVDTYSSQEVGYIALQCPDHEHLHVQAESLIVEILREDDTPCAAGEIGRVVVTTLHNFAMPLIRYDIGDYAELGQACSCGRGLTVLNKVLGRQRNMLVLPDGQRRWPTLVRGNPALLPAIEQFQFVQRSLDELELRIVRAEPLTSEEAERLIAYVRETLEYPGQLRVRMVAEIPRSASGKYEEFRSELGVPDGS